MVTSEREYVAINLVNMRSTKLETDDIVLLREARLLLHSAFMHGATGEHPIAGSKARESLIEIDNAFDPDGTSIISADRIPELMDAACYAMHSLWIFSDVSRHPTLATRFNTGLKLIEARILEFDEYQFAQAARLAQYPFQKVSTSTY